MPSEPCEDDDPEAEVGSHDFEPGTEMDQGIEPTYSANLYYFVSNTLLRVHRRLIKYTVLNELW